MIFNIEQPRVLAIGAHPDDIELGAAGLIYRLVKEERALVSYLILSPGLKSPFVDKSYEVSQRVTESQRAAKVIGVSQDKVTVLEYEECGLHACGHKLIDDIEKRVYDTETHDEYYDIVITHAGQDTHSDHREVFEATISALRYFRGTVLLYQSPSTKPNGFHPTFFARLTDDIMYHKFEALLQHESQRDKKYMRRKWIEGMASTWAFFHRVGPRHESDDAIFWEAFEINKAFWK